MANSIIKSQKKLSIETILAMLKDEFPEYDVKSRNSLAAGEYVQVRKSAFIGVWVRIKKKSNTLVVVSCVPSDWARALFFGLILYLFISSSLNQMQQEVYSFLQEKFES